MRNRNYDKATNRELLRVRLESLNRDLDTVRGWAIADGKSVEDYDWYHSIMARIRTIQDSPDFQ